MRILFLHDNFPAQFGAFGQYLAKEGWEVWFGTHKKGVSAPGFQVFHYEPHRSSTQGVHPYASKFEQAVLTGQAVARSALNLRRNGFVPDVVMAHSGWGPGLFVKDVWQEVKYLGYFEWYYRGDSPEISFLPHGMGLDDILRMRSRNAAILMDLSQCDGAICPTEFQRAQFPTSLRNQLTVMHDGIDTDYYAPTTGAKLVLPGLDLGQIDELVTYVARGMEPYRGFPEFVKALEIVLAARPQAHAVIVGDDRVAYGRKLPEGDTYKKRAMRDVPLDWKRVHFTGLLPRAHYRLVLQASSVHVYLTIPFVLSWSMMEAMSAGCAIVASDVEPVRELARMGEAPFSTVSLKEPESIAASIIRLLEERSFAAKYGAAARALILDRYAAKDLHPRKRDWIAALLT